MVIVAVLGITVSTSPNKVDRWSFYSFSTILMPRRKYVCLYPRSYFARWFLAVWTGMVFEMIFKFFITSSKIMFRSRSVVKFYIFFCFYHFTILYWGNRAQYRAFEPEKNLFLSFLVLFLKIENDSFPVLSCVFFLSGFCLVYFIFKKKKHRKTEFLRVFTHKIHFWWQNLKNISFYF